MISITDLTTAKKYFPVGDHKDQCFDYVISLISPYNRNNIKSNSPYHFVDYFDDVLSGPDAPTQGHINKILKFSEQIDLNNDEILVHCTAGISRSTATAIGILCQKGYNPHRAIQTIQRIRPQLSPNQLMIEYFDFALNLQGDLIWEISEFYKKNIGKMIW